MPGQSTPSSSTPLSPPIQIVLTAAQADQVRGLTKKGHALAPAPLNDGTFALPMSVLDDPAHASLKSLLLQVTRRSVDPTEYMAYGYGGRGGKAMPAGISALVNASSFDLSWKAGKPVAIAKTTIDNAVAAVAAAKIGG